MTDWRCPHGLALTERGECADCNRDIEQRPEPSAMTGDERAEEVRTLLNEANAYFVDAMHKRLEALVGRPVWTHEFATDTRLVEEARGALPHPDDLNQHALDSLQAVADGKPIIVVDPRGDR